jgi:hypothetical protein
MVRTAFFVTLLAATSAWASVPLRTLPPGDALKLEPLAARGELALIESHPNGRLRQITIWTLVDAPPEKVEQVVGRPAEYPQFVSNVVRSDITGHTGDGGLFYEWELDVPLVNLKGPARWSSGRHRSRVRGGPCTWRSCAATCTRARGTGSSCRPRAAGRCLGITATRT